MRVFTFLLICLSGFPAFAQTASRAKFSHPLTIGESITIYSEYLQEDRLLNVYLPLSYHPDSALSYPVIYLLDGSIDEDMIHVSGLVQFGSFSWINMIPETIVVGIANVDRQRDFTHPSKNTLDQQEFPTSGGSKAFISFVGLELQEFINRRYRVNGQRTLIGQSLGGLLATEILYRNPGYFDHYIIVSPSLWWDDGSLLQSTPVMRLQEKVFVAVGKEGEVMERDARRLFEKLQAHYQERISFQYLQDCDHGDALHLAVYGAFKFLFEDAGQ